MTKKPIYLDEDMVEGPCENCLKQVHVGHCVVPYEDVGDMHWNCEHPFRYPHIPPKGTEDDPHCFILAGDPVRYLDPYQHKTREHANNLAKYLDLAIALIRKSKIIWMGENAASEALDKFKQSTNPGSGKAGMEMKK